jgi:transposase
MQSSVAPDPAKMKEVGMDGKHVIGVDVGKRFLDVSREGAARVERQANDAAGVAALAARLDAARDVVVFERTGGGACPRAGLRPDPGGAELGSGAGFGRRGLCGGAFAARQGVPPGAGSRPRPIRSMRGCCRSSGATGSPPGLRFGRLEGVTLHALLMRQRQLKDALHAERCRLDTAALACVRASLQRMVEQLEAEIAAIEAELAALEQSDAELAAKAAALRTMIGVGHITARALIAELPELGRLDRKEITALGGLARASTRAAAHKSAAASCPAAPPSRSSSSTRPAPPCATTADRRLLPPPARQGQGRQARLDRRHAQAPGALECGAARLPGRARQSRRRRPGGSLSRRSSRPEAAARAGGQGRRSRRAAVPLIAEHAAAPSPRQSTA